MILDGAGDQHVHAHGDGEIGLAGAGGADAEAHLVLVERAHIGLLGVGARFDQLLAGLDLDLAALEHLELAAAGLFLGLGSEAELAVDVGPAHRASLLEPLVERAEHLAGGGLRLFGAVDRELVAAAQDLHPGPGLDIGEVAVEFAAQIDQQPVVGEFEDGFCQSACRHACLLRLESLPSCQAARGRASPRDAPTPCADAKRPRDGHRAVVSLRQALHQVRSDRRSPSSRPA